MCLKTIENASLGLAAAGLVLFLGNVWLISDAQATQREVNIRAAQIQDGVKLANLNNELVRALGSAVVQNKDEKIKGLLAEHGITIEQKPAAAK